MGFYLWISEGDDGADTRPVLASTDPEILREFMHLLTERVCSRIRHPLEYDSGVPSSDSAQRSPSRK